MSGAGGAVAVGGQLREWMAGNRETDETGQGSRTLSKSFYCCDETP